MSIKFEDYYEQLIKPRTGKTLSNQFDRAALHFQLIDMMLSEVSNIYASVNIANSRGWSVIAKKNLEQRRLSRTILTHDANTGIILRPDANVLENER
jgi:hypothetical protein